MPPKKIYQICSLCLTKKVTRGFSLTSVFCPNSEASLDYSSSRLQSDLFAVLMTASSRRFPSLMPCPRGLSASASLYLSVLLLRLLSIDFSRHKKAPSWGAFLFLIFPLIFSFICCFVFTKTFFHSLLSSLDSHLTANVRSLDSSNHLTTSQISFLENSLL